MTNKPDIIIGKIKNYELVLERSGKGFAILFEEGINSCLIAKYVGKTVKIRIEELI